jgi:glycosyltransferase involved in cell wall biosynthesis
MPFLQAAPRIAIVHYWLVGMRGGERVLEHLLAMFPDADIYTHVVDRDRISPAIARHPIHTTFIARLPFARRWYQKYVALMPLALEALDMTGYDIVISCEAGPAKGVIVRPDAVHLTYCHSPMRYIWDQYHQYRREAGFVSRWMMTLLAPYLRGWDIASAARSDLLVANSDYVRRRIAKSWGRDARVVHPPVEVGLFGRGEPGDEYVWVGQLVPYKRPDVAVDAFRANGRRLHVIGDGPMLVELKRRAGPGTRFTPRLDFAALRTLYATARALVFTAEEDFGLVPIEVMASGRPVIAYGRGGALETVGDGVTGLFYTQQTPAALNEALDRFDDWVDGFDPAAAEAQAARFSPERFRDGIADALVEAARAAAGHRA